MSQHPTKIVLVVTTLAASALLWPLLGHGDKTYKWIDPDGNLVYTDRPPPPGTPVLEAYEQQTTVDPRQAALEQATAENPVVLYTVPVCDACDLVRNLLDKQGIPYTEKNAEDDAEVQQEIKDKAGQLAVPVLGIGPKVITGYVGTLIRSELAEAGYVLDDPAAYAGGSGAGATAAAEEGELPLSAEQAAADAADAAEELLADSPSDLADLPPSDSVEDWEEIPEDERIPIPSLQQ